MLVVAFVGMLGCFIPLGQVPLVWSLQGIHGARQVTLGIFGVAIALALLGRRDQRMSLLPRIAGLVTTGWLVAFCIFRFAVLGTGGLPNFEDDDPRAGAYYDKACAAGVMEACARLGACYWTGTCGVALDAQRGLALHQKACDGGAVSACGQLGVCYELGGCGLGRSGERAVALYEKACAGGDPSMCNNLGVCYHKGQCGLFQDLPRAKKLYQRACKDGDSGACHNLDLLRN